MFPKKEQTQKELQELVRALAWNDAFGCYTRAGFEKLIWPAISDQAKWIIYFDVDGMHALNEHHGGYEAADAMIKQTLSSMRLTDYVAGQWKSGDEFLICLVEPGFTDPLSGMRESIDPQRMMERLIDELKRQGLTATFAIVPVISPDLPTNIKPAVDKVYAAKNSRSARPLR